MPVGVISVADGREVFGNPPPHLLAQTVADQRNPFEIPAAPFKSGMSACPRKRAAPPGAERAWAPAPCRAARTARRQPGTLPRCARKSNKGNSSKGGDLNARHCVVTATSRGDAGDLDDCQKRRKSVPNFAPR